MAEGETRRVNILVCGSTGALRSPICNGIVGEDMLKEDMLKESEDIMTVETWEDDRNSIAIEVTSIATYDDVLHEPGQYQEKINEISEKQFDLFLYCLPVKVARPSLEEEKRGYEELKRLLHESVWRFCVVVLTYADSIVLRCQTKYNSSEISRKVKDDYNSTIKGWISAVHQLFESQVEVIAAGSPQCVSILEDGNLWLSKLFLAIQEKTEDTLTSKILLLKNFHRITETVGTKDSILRSGVHEQPIIITEKSSKVRQKLKEISPGLGAGAAAGLIGAAAGGLTGGLAIGIPSFGVFAATGMAAGAVLGGAIAGGTVVGVKKAASNAEKQSRQEGLCNKDGIM